MQNPTEIWQLSPEHRDLCKRFEAAYNSIDSFLRDRLHRKPSVPFVSLLDEYKRSVKRAADFDYLYAAARLRNLMVHYETEPYQPLAVPTLPAVRRLEAILNSLTDPLPVIPRFERSVEVLTMDEPLAEVLKRVAQRDYSQFPVYENENFRGLLTENGITRWLARHVSKTLSLVDLGQVLVKKVLPEEEKQPNSPNCRFVSRRATVHEVKVLFAEIELLEAVLITEGGDETEKLLGIVTRWDVLHEV